MKQTKQQPENLKCCYEAYKFNINRLIYYMSWKNNIIFGAPKLMPT